uniref:Single domain-containing protein n=1 Tax=Amblyomma cajennense TaxID=34607 RepID=A0A023FPP0_AMBCJ
MVKILILAVTLTACIAIGEGWTETVTSVQFVNGTCMYQGYTLEDGETEYPYEFCEHWTCNAKKKTLTVQGCNIGPRYSSCFHHHSRGYWKSCCRYRPYC